MTKYVLGSNDAEIARLDGQAASIEGPTRLLLRAAGIGPGMRVLDLGTGLGHVAKLVAERVGSTGRVVGLDNSARLLEVAKDRASGLPHVQFTEGDVRTWQSGEPFDVVVGRLILFHLPDAVAVLRHQLGNLRPDGVLLALDFDVGSTRAEPPVPLFTEVDAWVRAGFRSAGADPVIGTRLGLLLGEAGLEGVQTFGIQGYLAPTDPRGPAALAGAVRALAPQLIGAGLATAEQLGLDTLADRLGAAARASGSAILPPALAGAWGRKP